MKGEEWKAVYVTHDGKLVHNLGTRIQLIGRALERGYDKTSGKSGGEYLQTEYLKNEDEYLVSGAQLRCSMATSKKMTIEGRTYVPENPSETTYLECEENRMESGGGKVNATTKDCVVYKNIKPFRCNCRVGPCDDEEKDMLLVDESCLTDGTCKALIDLSEHWDNYPSQIPHFRYKDERFGEVSGITMMSMLFCKHGGIITPVTSGQEIESYPPVFGEFVGYLAYGAKEITQNPEEGYFMLYDGPTVAGEGREYYFADIYAEFLEEGGSGALQGFGGSVKLNKTGGIVYEDEDNFTSQRGTLRFKGIERHTIALGPALQNPDLNLDPTKTLDAEDMIYGTCVDIIVPFEGENYYIPAVIVDTKHYTAPHGYIQGSEAFGGGEPDTRKGNNIVEWYVTQGENEKNKSSGLSEFDTMGGLIIYDGETLVTKKED